MKILPAAIRFRPVEHGDLDTLYAWHRRPHVLEWWPDPPSIHELLDRCEKRAAGDGNLHFHLALLDPAQPIGFVQSYRPADCHPDGWWLDVHDRGVIGMDQFVAHPEFLNRGLGTAMVCAFVELCFAGSAVSRVQADPSPRNFRAIRCYGKAGFAIERDITTPDGPALLMVRDRLALR